MYNVFGKKEGKRRKIFMGDTGSLTLGYISSFFIVIFSSQNDFFSNNGNYYDYVIVAFSTIIVPVFDLIRVAFSRIIKGVSPFNPDMNHLHHKLIKLGFSMRKAMLLIVALSCLFVLISIIEFKYIEEPELEKRFGKIYSEYKEKTPLIIPKIRRESK